MRVRPSLLFAAISRALFGTARITLRNAAVLPNPSLVPPPCERDIPHSAKDTARPNLLRVGKTARDAKNAFGKKERELTQKHGRSTSEIIAEIHAMLRRLSLSREPR